MNFDRNSYLYDPIATPHCQRQTKLALPVITVAKEHGRDIIGSFAVTDLVVLYTCLRHGHSVLYFSRDAHGVVWVHYGRAREHAAATREFTGVRKHMDHKTD